MDSQDKAVKVPSWSLWIFTDIDNTDLLKSTFTTVKSLQQKDLITQTIQTICKECIIKDLLTMKHEILQGMINLTWKGVIAVGFKLLCDCNGTAVAQTKQVRRLTLTKTGDLSCRENIKHDLIHSPKLSAEFYHPHCRVTLKSVVTGLALPSPTQRSCKL